MIADTRSSAEGALNASHAYQAIVDAISTAENATLLANKAVLEALDDVSIPTQNNYELSRGVRAVFIQDILPLLKEIWYGGLKIQKIGNYE